MVATLRYPPINPRVPHFLHGGDYNPEQWPEEIWREDMRLMKKANCNTMTVGIFSWAALEPKEGVFEFHWLDRIMDMLAENDCYAAMATPTAARPAWMSKKYPEVTRVNEEGQRMFPGHRLRFCLTSPIFAEKRKIITRKIAERFRQHPALIMWHVNNEIRGKCYCDFCIRKFREWLAERYGTVENLNHRWRTAFWSHTYTQWEQVEPPRSRNVGESSIQSLHLDWNRFSNAMVAQMVRQEGEILREVTPEVPITVNEGNMFAQLDVRDFIPYVDALAWDNYPQYHDLDDNWKEACRVSFRGEFWRSAMNGRPFVLMESTPSATAMHGHYKLKRPGVHLQSSLQAVAHGADSVLYFQWRQSQGGIEKLQGGVVAHSGHENTRVFREVAEVGSVLKRLDDVIGTSVDAEVAILYDRQNEWAVMELPGPRKLHKDYRPTCEEHYRPFWMRGIPVDVIHMEQDFGKYKLVVAPMLYMLLPEVAERLEEYVRTGGTLVVTYWSGIVDECDIVFYGGFPGPLRKCLGIWSEELDVIYDKESVSIVPSQSNGLSFSGTYEARHFCDLIHSEGAEVLATYGNQFYAGRPALTCNHFGAGKAYYMASRNDERFQTDFYGALANQLNLRQVLDTDLPEGVSAQMRTDGKTEYVFLFNYKRDLQRVNVGTDGLRDVIHDCLVRGEIELSGYGTRIFSRIKD